MTDAKGNFKGEDLALDAIVVALISVAVAFLAFGLAQLDSLQAYKPYIFVSAGLVYLLIPVFLIQSLKRAKSGKFDYSEKSNVGTGIKNFFSELEEPLKAFIIKYKMLIILAFVFVTGVATAGFLPSIGTGNFSLPSLQLPTFNFTQSSSQGVVVAPTGSGQTAIPVKIADFMASKDGETHNLNFSLADKDGNKVASSGSGVLKVMNSDDEVVYEKSFSINASDFAGNIFSLSVADSEITKSVSGSGTAKLSYTTELGVEMSSEASIGIPKLSSTEIAEAYDNEYKSTATDVGKSAEKYLFKATVLRMGFFKKVSGDDTKVYFRVDVTIENKGAVEETFKTSTAKLTIGGNSYAPSTAGTLAGGKIKGKTTQSGYLLFEDVPTTITGTKTIRTGTVTTEVSTFEYIVDA